jgi:threonine synthase
VIPGKEAIRGLRCLRCGAVAPPAPIAYLCEKCGGNQEVELDLALVRDTWPREELDSEEDQSMWRYAPLLPVESRLDGPPVGMTPLISAPALARRYGVGAVLVKDDGRNPSASFKDRASAVALAHAREAGHDLVVAASTGNAAAATAVLAAPAKMKARIFVPRTAPRAKIAQLITFGAEVFAVDGTYDQAFDLSVAATRRFGWYNRNTGFNPFTREGKKTVSFEICEQLGRRAPDLVVVPVGDGNIISAVWKGFLEFQRLGIVESLPRLLAVQAAGSAAIATALAGDGVVRPVAGESVADSIAVSFPRDGDAAVKAVRDSGGFAVTVSDEEILAAIPDLARSSGVFAEPAAAAGLAGLARAHAEGRLGGARIVVLLVTGNGLKDVAAAMRTAGEPRLIPPDPAALDGLFGA